MELPRTVHKRCSLMLPYSFREQLHELKRCCWFYRWSVCMCVCAASVRYSTYFNRTTLPQKYLMVESRIVWPLKDGVMYPFCDMGGHGSCVHVSLCDTSLYKFKSHQHILSQYLACWELHYNLRVVPKLFILSVWNRLYFFPCTKRI